ncbi:hypothetical protein AC249_AIPGENE6286, partial [Exaiptasia diaphana]
MDFTETFDSDAIAFTSTPIKSAKGKSINLDSLSSDESCLSTPPKVQRTINLSDFDESGSSYDVGAKSIFLDDSSFSENNQDSSFELLLQGDNSVSIVETTTTGNDVADNDFTLVHDESSLEQHGLCQGNDDNFDQRRCVTSSDETTLKAPRDINEIRSENCVQHTSSIIREESTLKRPRDIRFRTDEEILWLLSVPCCKERCLHHFSICDIQQCEVNLKDRKQTDQRNYLLDFLHQHGKLDDSGEYYEVEFVFKGKHVCREAWLLAHNVSKSSFRRVMAKFKEGAVQVEHGNKGRRTVRDKTGQCIAWLEYFFKTIGDFQPTSNAIHLPSCFSKIDIYRKMFEENTAFNQPTLSLSHFYKIWEKHFNHVTIPKENRFTKCTECTRF